MLVFVASSARMLQVNRPMIGAASRPQLALPKPHVFLYAQRICDVWPIPRARASGWGRRQWGRDI